MYAFTTGSGDHLPQALDGLRDTVALFDRAMLMLLGTATGSPEATDERRRRGIALQAAARRGGLETYIDRLRSCLWNRRRRQWIREGTWGIP
ncbi:hypothetical protein ACQEU5_07350 [Marinactinospora thermotolerans]|uniref:hypothetical protein n=1 Tax=Marinactinospora thermotolerans TaxID=531310 RepID=UPI003D8ECB74